MRNLNCSLCEIDPTASAEKKNKKFNRSGLDTHVKSDFHARENELLRAFNVDRDSKAAVTCPLCLRRRNVQRFLKHLREKHHEHLL